jgi:SAM-dependent methyltransferase
VDELVAFCGLQPSKTKVLLEIGCGAGRMTRRFAELYGQVVALDVSDEMLRQGQANLADLDNVAWVLGSGADLNAIADGSVDEVFSYITLQHLPDRAAVLRYIQDTGRVLRPGGRGALQVRRPGLLPWALDLVGHLAHAAQGRRVWSKAWRGRACQRERCWPLPSGRVSVPTCSCVAAVTCGSSSGAPSRTTQSHRVHHRRTPPSGQSPGPRRRWLRSEPATGKRLWSPRIAPHEGVLAAAAARLS